MTRTSLERRTSDFGPRTSDLGPRPPRLARWPLLVAVALVALNVAVYSAVGHFDFVQLDDPAYVTENPNVTNGITANAVAWAFTTGHAANWHPLTWLSHMLDVQLFGVVAGPHHMVNVILHTLNTLVLFLLLLWMTYRVWPSALVAALFGVHPLHVESVAWIAERKDVLSTFFWMLTLLAYVWYVKAADCPPRSHGRLSALARYALVIVCFALGLMAKPMLVTLPFVLLLLDIWPLARVRGSRAAKPRAKAGGPQAQARRPQAQAWGLREWWPLVREKVPLFALAAASSVVTVIAQQRGGAVSNLEAIPIGLRVGNAIVSSTQYLISTIWPARLSILYPIPDTLSASQIAGALVVLAGISVVVVRLAARAPYLLVGWLWYLGTLVPVSGLVQVGLQARADRYAYVPLIGIFIMVAWSSAALAARGRVLRAALPVAAAVVVLSCTVAAHQQVRYWKDNVTLWTHATMLTLHQDEYQAHMSLGTTLGNQGRLDEATRHFAEAVRLQPGSVEAQTSLGLALAKQGKAAEATAAFAEAVRLQPRSDAARVNLGLALAQAGRPGDAMRELEEALRLNPQSDAARRALQMIGR